MKRLSVIACAMMLVLVSGSIMSCASDSRQDTPRQSEIRKDSDRFFDKMKDEERVQKSGR